MIAPVFKTSDLEQFSVQAVANGWLMTLRSDSYRRGEVHGEQFVFRTPEELAAFLVKTLPRHEEKQ